MRSGERAPSPAEDHAGPGARNAEDQPPNFSGGSACQTEASKGSYGPDDPDRPRWDATTRVEDKYDYRHADGTYAYTKIKGRRADGQKTFLTGRRFQGSTSDLQMERQQFPHEFYYWSGLEAYRKGKGDEPSLLYRLDELIGS